MRVKIKDKQPSVTFIVAYFEMNGYELTHIIEPESRINPSSFEPNYDEHLFTRTYYGAKYKINIWKMANLMREIKWMHGIKADREILSIIDYEYVDRKPFIDQCSPAYLRKHTLIQI
jgi:hypothetical protein